MISFLTSSFVPYQKMEEYIPLPLADAFGFAGNLRKYWPESARILIFASDPAGDLRNDHVKNELYQCFTLADFPVTRIRVFDDRAIEAYARKHALEPKEAARAALQEELSGADVFFLAGGHAPTENAFMRRCGLKELITNPDIFDGIFIGLSAGTINAASTVYLIPELEGEAVDASFVRTAEGLGLTDLHVLPHSQYEKHVVLDGLRLIEDIIAPDSRSYAVYMITDGSYFMIRNGVTEFFGEGEIIERGKVRPLYPGIITADHDMFKKAGSKNELGIDRFFDSFHSAYFECLFTLDAVTENITFYHISQKLLAYGIIPIHLDRYSEFTGLFAQRLVVDDERQSFLEQTELAVVLDEIEKKGTYVRTVHIDTGDGIVSENVHIDRYAGEDDRYMVTISDISMVLDHDWMTDEYSRSGFLAKLAQMLKDPKYQQGYAVVYTNIMGFKAVNDLMGNFSGDMAIFAERDLLVKTFSPALIARLESDHFAMVVQTDKLTKKTLKHLRLYAKQGSKKMPLTIQCGIYEIKDPTKTALHMLDRAKLTENSISKKHGEVYAFYNEDMTRTYLEQRKFVADLDKAIKMNEFKAYFQPIVDANTGEIVSAEALIRWIRPGEGVISPARFVPVFEREGEISKLDMFMVKQVMQMNRSRLSKKRKVVPCAINMSRVDFYDVNMVRTIRQYLTDEKQIAKLIKLEVTESAYEALGKDALSFLNHVKAKGVSILLDDFGSGMSSLGAIRDFEYDTIKLDMGLVAQIGKSTKSEAMLRHSIGLFHDLGSRVVAEGVETEAQLEFLREAGCDYIQGYYFYKPMSMEEFELLLDR